MIHSTDSIYSQLANGNLKIHKFITLPDIQPCSTLQTIFIILYGQLEADYNIKHELPSVSINICSIFEAKWLSPTLGSLKL